MGKEERFDLPEYNGGSLNLTATSGLLSLDWARDVAREPATVPVLTAGALVSSESELPPDHLFSTLLHTGLLHDMLCLYNSQRQQFHTLVTLGPNVCGHPRITHGGMTAAIIDETLGGLNYVLKREGVVPHGPSFTVHLEVGYKAPVPASTSLICTASLDSLDGRKAWVSAQVLDKPGGTLYATGKALFVIPKDKMLPPSKQSEGAAFSAKRQDGRAPETETEVERLSIMT
ncbi:g1712 [Coccomyxa viridis]|uniref:G1712 protein n=1 Tax=Coccomyxa viridis TaxID=1274662 RepID=A0ABP1FIL9_9CHLO